MICCHQITKPFRSKYLISSAFSARGPCNFGPFADFVISVFLELARYSFLSKVPDGAVDKMLLGASLKAEASSSSKISMHSSNHSSRSRNGLPRAPSMSSFWFLWNLATIGLSVLDCVYSNSVWLLDMA